MWSVQVSIVLTGVWNRAIFTPEWVQHRVFVDVRDIEVELLFGPSSGIRFTADGLSLTVLAGRVVVGPMSLSADSLDGIEKVTGALLEALPETPLSARGINFLMTTTDADVVGDLIPRVESSERLKAVSRRTGWTFQFDDDLLRVNAERRADGVRIEFNHHRDGKRASDLRGSVVGCTRECLDRTRDVARELNLPEEMLAI